MLGIALAAFLVTQPALARFVHCDNDINVIATRLSGHWDLNSSMSTESNAQLAGLSFFPDGSVLPFFEKVDTGNDICAYASGYMMLDTLRGETLTRRPYVLTQHDGIPLIVWLEQYGEEGFDQEVFQTFIITGESTNGSTPSADDKLIIGGDSNSGSGMLVFNRVLP